MNFLRTGSQARTPLLTTASLDSIKPAVLAGVDNAPHGWDVAGAGFDDDVRLDFIQTNAMQTLRPRRATALDESDWVQLRRQAASGLTPNGQ